MKSTYRTLLVVLLASLALPVFAQPGPGKGNGFRFNRDNTPGWSMMTRQEHRAHREKMLSFKTNDECMAYLNEHHKLMEERAKERGKMLPMPRVNACERMKARGMLK